MTLKLADLSPHMHDAHPNERGYQEFSFSCPGCRNHRERIAISSAPAHDVKWKDAETGIDCHVRVWQATQGPLRDWATLSLTPSINIVPCEKLRCAGWHGHLTNGEMFA